MNFHKANTSVHLGPRLQNISAHPSQKTPSIPLLVTNITPPPTRVATVLASSITDEFCLVLYIIKVESYSRVFCIWLLFFNMMFGKAIHSVVCTCALFILFAVCIPLYEYITTDFSIQLLMDT